MEDIKKPGVQSIQPASPAPEEPAEPAQSIQIPVNNSTVEPVELLTGICID